MTEEKKYTLEELQDDLNEQQKIFCHNYICKFNATQSYKDSYGIVEDNTAGAAGNRLLRNVKIIEYIDFIKKDYEKEAGLTKLSQLKAIIKIIEHKDSSSRDIISAIAEANKMMGYLEPEKHSLQFEGKKIKLNFGGST